MDLKKFVRENWVEIGIAGAIAYWLFKSEKGKKVRDAALVKVRELIDQVLSAIQTVDGASAQAPPAPAVDVKDAPKAEA